MVDKVPPFGDPNWLQGVPNLYYNDSHRKFQKAVRKWIDEEVIPNVHEWETTKRPPKDLHKKCYEAGILPGIFGSWPTELGCNIAGGIKPEEWDLFQ